MGVTHCVVRIKSYQIGAIIEMYVEVESHANVKGCTHRAMIPCDWDIDSNQKE